MSNNTLDRTKAIEELREMLIWFSSTLYNERDVQQGIEDFIAFFKKHKFLLEENVIAMDEDRIESCYK